METLVLDVDYDVSKKIPYEMNVDLNGELALIHSVINQAIVDSIAVKKPREKKYKISDDDLNNALIIICAYEQIKKRKKYKLYDTIIFYLKELTEIEFEYDFYDKKVRRNEINCVDARKFLKKDNETFNFYCHIADIDSEIIVNKINKKINSFYQK